MYELRTGWGVKVAMSLRHRSALSAKIPVSSARVPVMPRSRRKIAAAARFIAENLESRILLTTLHGGGSTPLDPEMPGDTFVFFGEDSVNAPFKPVYETIKLFGNITAEVIGRDSKSQVLENLPGQLNGADVDGGFALPPGATPVGVLQANPTNVEAIAIDPASGQMYGITSQVVTFPPVPPSTTPTVNNNIYLVTIDKTTGATTQVAEISQQILAASGIQVGPNNTQLVSGISAMTFVGGTLFLAASIGAGGGGGGNSHLVSFNPANPLAIGGTQGTFGGATITGLANINGNLFASSKTSVFPVNLGNTDNINGAVNPTVNGPISGIAQNAAGQIFVQTNNTGATSELYWINPVATPADGKTGTDAIDYGPLPPTVIVNNGVQLAGPTGANPGSMAFDPTTGTLYSFDFADNQLYTVSQTIRVRALTIFQIYISSSDSTGEIFTSNSDVATTENGDGFMTPYGAGPVGGFNVTDAQPPHLIINVADPALSGNDLIGARTQHLTPNVVNDVNFPVTTGTIAAPFANAPYTSGTTISSGVVSGPGTAVGQVNISGPILGDVHLAGSIDTFYGGWLLTGDANGELTTNLVDDPGNFSVAGDLRNLLVSDSIGTNTDSTLTAPHYVTGFDMHVSGTIGRVQTFDSIIGNVNDVQSPTAQNLTTNLLETEVKGGGPDPWGAGILSASQQPEFSNDTFATAQIINTLPTVVNGLPSAVALNGTLQADANGDFVDYYGMALLAGQTITVQVVQLIPPPLVIDLGVFNPDGDLVATDYNAVDLTQTQQKTFRITADRPGIYRFAVATTGDANFTLAGGAGVGVVPYLLTIQDAGDVAVGGIVATNNIFDNVDPLEPEASFGVQTGDLGAISAGGSFFSSNPGNTVNVLTGSIRDIDAGSVGLNAGAPFDPEIQVPNGSVGLVSATSTTGGLYFNYPLLGLPPAIGGNYQLLSSAADFDAKLIADGSIGVVRAAQMQGVAGGFILGPQIFSVNADHSTTPGNIDLIDVTGDLGTIAGGPEFITGPQGNVGYIRVGGTAFRDPTFGGGTPEATLYQPGESATLTDDSGAQVVITPTDTPSIPANGGLSNDNSGTLVNPGLPQLTITALPIEGSGGVAIANITSTGGVTITGTGQEAGQTVQIGVIDAQGLGETLDQLVLPPAKNTQPTQPVIPPNSTGTGGTTTGTGGTTTTTTAPTFFTGPDTAGPVGRTNPLPNPPILDPNSASPLDVILTGSARMDAFEVDGGMFSSITDSTGGDIVNVNATSVGTLSSNGQIGLSQNHTGAALNGVAVVANTFPLIDVHNAINIGVAGGVTPGGVGPVNPITTTSVVNNVTTTTTTTVVTTPAIVAAPVVGIGSIIAAHGIGNINVGTNNTVGFIGTIQASILGPVFATGSIFSTVLGSDGIASSGSGAGSQAGLYAVGQIGAVSNSAPCDIRGSIVSESGLTGINLKNGSIINTTLGNLADVNMSVQLPIARGTLTVPSPITNPVLDVGNVIVTGSGGIIGTSFNGEHLGHIDIYHGFGFIDSAITVVGDGTVAGILADGYGIRKVTFIGGSSMGPVVATGNGRNISTQVYSPDVRLSETNSFDPFFGTQPNDLTDIDIVTTATAQVPQVAGFDGGGTDTGVIEDCTFVGNRTLTSVRAYQIRATDPVAAPTIFNFGNSIGSITTKSSDDGLAVITGRMQSFQPGGNIDHLAFQIAGPIKNLNINGNVTNNSVISASGKNGNIGKLRVGGSLQGSITAARTIQNVLIGGNLTGTVSAAKINTVKVVGSLNGGNLDVEGSVNKLQFMSDLGLPGETLTIHGSVNAITIAGNLNADIVVEGNLGTLTVGQSVIAGTLTDIDKTLGNLVVDGDFQAGATIQAALIKHVKVKGLNQGTLNG